jgi:hypothetical protein
MLIKIGDTVAWSSVNGKRKTGIVREILPTCIKVFCDYTYWDGVSEKTGQGVFPLVPGDCEVLDQGQSEEPSS